MELTLFSNVSDETLSIYRACGFNWEEPRYINIFRWLWNEKHYHPSITCFPGDVNNKAFCVLERATINGQSYKFVADSYDDAIIEIVNYIGKNHQDYLKT